MTNGDAFWFTIRQLRTPLLMVGFAGFIIVNDAILYILMYMATQRAIADLVSRLFQP